ncbi:TPA: SIR2 family protein [Streptococcus suis]|nr:hypothetical protein [Streptococcus suis]HEM5997348.1 SIR2 family protein [Streptococcus suis]HEM6371799.1 SIR2 family protein [Streptococcus suis]
MTFIESIKTKNQYPIIFIGSGITQRYFKDSPTWEGLLKEIWLELFEEEDFYTKLFELRQEYNNDFEIYTHLADFLEKEIDTAFWKKKLQIQSLTFKKAHENKLSPFKEFIATKFRNLSPREGMEEEIKEFSKMLAKARIIITTNYDTFIEDCLRSVKAGIKVNIGNKGLFSKSSDYGELFKIHGSVTDANTIAITSLDYVNNKEKSSIVNAKILSNLVEAPILFLGYSLTDENIRKLLTDFARNSPYDIKESSEKIAVVEYVPHQMEVVDVISSLTDLSVHYTQIKTDNFIEIYKAISAIEQGYLPSEISKFERVFRKIIEIKGEDRELKTVLTTYLELSSLSDREIRDKNIVVAFGDDRYVYKFPDVRAFVKDYFRGNSDMPIEIALGFISNQPSKSYFPFRKYINSIETYIEKNAGTEQSQKLYQHLEKEREFNYDEFIQLIGEKVAKVHLSKFEGCQSLNDIMLLDEIPRQQRLTYITSHLNRFDIEDIQVFIENLIDTTEKFNTDIRKLLKVFDYYSVE